MKHFLVSILIQQAATNALGPGACKGASGPSPGLKEPWSALPHLSEVLESELLAEEPHGEDSSFEEQQTLWESRSQPVTIDTATAKATNMFPGRKDLISHLPDLLVLLVAFAAFKLARYLWKADQPAACSDEAGPRTYYRKETTDAFGCTELHIAASKGCSLEVRKLLEGRSDPNAREAWDETPLHMAARSGSLEVAEMLLSSGAHLDACNADERTPLVAAAEENQEEVCKLLLDRGASAGGMEDSKLPRLLSTLLLQRLMVAPEQHEDADANEEY